MGRLARPGQIVCDHPGLGARPVAPLPSLHGFPYGGITPQGDRSLN